MKRWRVVALLALVAAAVCGCGYRGGSLVPSDIRTVHVPMFDNTTFRRGLEFDLTQAVQQELRRRTHLRLTDRDQADSVLSGEIVDFRRDLLARDVALNVIAEDVTLWINFRWTDLRTGRVLAEGAKISKTVRLYATAGEPVGAATAESFRWLAEEIVDRMEGGW